MTDTSTDGLRKAARRVFWEAKKIDEAKEAARTEVLSLVLEIAKQEVVAWQKTRDAYAKDKPVSVRETCDDVCDGAIAAIGAFVAQLEGNWRAQRKTEAR
jgi:hypothetical protein